jgi:hypothetical protein
VTDEIGIESYEVLWLVSYTVNKKRGGPLLTVELRSEAEEELAAEEAAEVGASTAYLLWEDAHNMSETI